MLNYWKKVVFENYANFEGRARRAEYWYFTLFNILIFVGAFILLSIVGALGVDALTALVSLVLIVGWLGLIIPSIAAVVRRLHDTGKSGWFYFVSLVPFVGGFILLFFLASDSTPGMNQYGPSPKYPPQGGYGAPQQGMGMPQQGFMPQQGMPQQGYPPQQQGMPPQGMPPQQQGFPQQQNPPQNPFT